MCTFIGHDLALADVNLHIPAGLYFKAQLKVLEYQIKAEVKFDHVTPSLYMDCDMSPIYWLGGLITVQRSETNDQEGPKLFIDIQKGKTQVDIKGMTSNIYCLI